MKTILILIFPYRKWNKKNGPILLYNKNSIFLGNNIKNNFSNQSYIEYQKTRQAMSSFPILSNLNETSVGDRGITKKGKSV